MRGLPVQGTPPPSSSQAGPGEELGAGPGQARLSRDQGRASRIHGNHAAREEQLGLCQGTTAQQVRGRSRGEGKMGARLLCLGQRPTLLPRDSRVQLDTRCRPLGTAVGKEKRQPRGSGLLPAPGPSGCCACLGRCWARMGALSAAHRPGQWCSELALRVPGLHLRLGIRISGLGPEKPAF